MDGLVILLGLKQKLSHTTSADPGKNCKDINRKCRILLRKRRHSHKQLGLQIYL